MDFSQFREMIVAAQDGSSSNNERKRQAFDAFFALKSSNPQQVILYSFQLVEDPELQHVGLLLLRSNMVGIEDHALMQAIAGRLCSLLVQTPTKVVASCMMSVVDYCTKNKETLQLIMDFVLSSLHASSAELQLHVCQMVETLCGMQLGRSLTVAERLLQAVQAVCAMPDPRAAVCGFKGSLFLLAGTEYCPAENNWVQEKIESIAELAFKTLARVLNEGSQRTQLEAITAFLDNFGSGPAFMGGYIPVALDLCRTLLHSNDVEIFKAGCEMVSDIVVMLEEYQFSAEDLKQIEGFISLLFQAIDAASVDEDIAVLCATDFENADDPNSFLSAVFGSQLTVCAHGFKMALRAFGATQFQKQTSKLCAAIMLAISDSHKPRSVLEGLLEMAFQIAAEYAQGQAGTEQSMAAYRFLLLLTNIYETQADKNVLREFAFKLMDSGYMEKFLGSEHVILLQGASDAMSMMIKKLDFVFAKRAAQLSSQLIEKAQTADMLTQSYTIQLLKAILDKVKDQSLLESATFYMQRFYALAPQVGRTLSEAESQYFKALLEIAASGSWHFGIEQQAFVECVVALALKEDIDEIHGLLDAIMVEIERFSARPELFANCLQQTLAQACQILETEYFKEAASITDSIADRDIRRELTSQQDHAARIILNLTVIPQTWQFSQQIVKALLCKCSTAYQLTRVVETLYALALTAVRAGDEQGFKGFVENIIQNGQDVINSEKNQFSFEECAKFFKALASLVEAYHLAGGPLELGEYIVKTTDFMFRSSRQSMQKAMEDAEFGDGCEEEEEEESEEDAQFSAMKILAGDYWVTADSLGQLAQACIKNKECEDQLIKIATSYGPDALAAAILREFLKAQSPRSRQIVETQYPVFLKYYEKADVKDRPISQFLCAATLHDVKAVQKTTLKNVLDDIQDGFQLAFILSIGLRYKQPRAIAAAIAWLQENPTCNAKVLIAQQMHFGLKSPKLSAETAEAFRGWLSAVAEMGEIPADMVLSQ